MQIRLSKVIDVMLDLMQIQLNLIYYGFGLKEPTDNIVPDVPSMLSIMNEFPKMCPLLPVTKPLGYVEAVQR